MKNLLFIFIVILFAPLYAKSAAPKTNTSVHDLNQTARLTPDDNESLRASVMEINVTSSEVSSDATSNTPSSEIQNSKSHTTIHALYLNRHTASPSTPQFKRALQSIETTPMNALVIDMKNVKGDLTYITKYSPAKRIGASRFSTIHNICSYIRALKKRGIYLIARIAVFKDRRQARTYPSRAVHTRRGSVWKDRHGESWVDPFDPDAREYTLALAEEVACLGFDEINFDYIRFPAHQGLRYDQPDTQTNRVDAIDSFLQTAKERLGHLGVKVSVDIFGYVLWNHTDTRIGQILEHMAPHVDYLCPMLYPSGFRRGSVSYSNPAAHPYDIVRISLNKGIARGVSPGKFRPWLQAFRDYAYSRHAYRERQIAAQIRAARDLNSSGWLLWHPSSRFDAVNPRLFALIDEEQVKEPDAVSYRPPTRRHSRTRHRRISGKKRRVPLRQNPLEILRGP